MLESLCGVSSSYLLTGHPKNSIPTDLIHHLTPNPPPVPTLFRPSPLSVSSSGKPIIVRVIRKSRPTVRDDVLSRVECIVVDEVDRLVDVLPKHTPTREVEKRKRHARPIAALLTRVIETKPDVQVKPLS